MLSLPDNLKSAIMQTVNCFLPYVSPAMVKLTVDELRSTGLVNKIYLLASDSLQAEACDGCEILQVDTLTGTNTLRTIWEHADERNVLFYTGTTPLRFGQNGLERMLFVAENRCCKIVYADHYKICNGIRQEHPLNDYQEGSNLTVLWIHIIKLFLATFPIIFFCKRIKILPDMNNSLRHK